MESILPLVGLSAEALDLDSRVKLAANPATPSKLLAQLASDGAVTVRAAVALNPSVPQSAQMQLAGDVDERVRLLLARKLASALPDLSGPAQTLVRERTLAVLSELVRDEAARIRAAIACCLAGLPGVSRDLILALAHDHEIEVSEPVLRLSPMLSAEDLLALLAAPPHYKTADAIACRANLPEDVSDAIASCAEGPAIRILLANESAAIREGTLDALIARAAKEPEWHTPLVRRPRLTDRAARALAEIVAAHLLRDLTERADLSAETIAAVRERLHAQLACRSGDHGPQSDQSLILQAHQLDAKGELTEAELLAALRLGENRRASALLAVAASVSLEIVDRAVSLRSAKALVSLAWKAGFTMQAAVPVQRMLGQIAPGSVLRPTSAGQSPLGQDEMVWQLDFLDGSCR